MKEVRQRDGRGDSETGRVVSFCMTTCYQRLFHVSLACYVLLRSFPVVRSSKHMMFPLGSRSLHVFHGGTPEGRPRAETQAGNKNPSSDSCLLNSPLISVFLFPAVDSASCVNKWISSMREMEFYLQVGVGVVTGT